MKFSSFDAFRRWTRDLKAAGVEQVREIAPDPVDQALARLNDPQVIDELFSNLQARTHGAGKIDPPRCRCGGAHDEDDCSYASVRGRPW